MYMHVNKCVELAQRGIALYKIYVLLLLLNGVRTDSPHPELSSCQIQTHKRLKGTLFIKTNDNMQILRVIPFIKLQNDTFSNSQTVKNEI